jgi:hypothetical protein
MRGARRIAFAWCVLPAAPLLLCGCLGRNYVDPDYRFRNEHLAQLREGIYTGAFDATARHRDPAQKPESAHVAAYPQPPAPAKQQRLVLTATLSGERGEAVRVVAEVRDAAGRSLHVPASLHLSVLQAGPGEQTTFLGDWELPKDLLEYAWTGSWSGGCYRLILPWKTWPSAEQVRVVAKLTLDDGTLCEAEEVLPLRTAAAPKPAEQGPPVRQVQASKDEHAESAVQPADLRWAPPSLEGELKLGRPVPLSADE